MASSARDNEPNNIVINMPMNYSKFMGLFLVSLLGGATALGLVVVDVGRQVGERQLVCVPNLLAPVYANHFVASPVLLSLFFDHFLVRF